MIRIGSKVIVTDLTDYLLCEGCVKKIKKHKASVSFAGKRGEYTYNIDDLEEVPKNKTGKPGKH